MDLRLPRRLVVGIFVGLLAATVVGIGIVSGRDARLDLCPVAGNKVLVSFEIPLARDYKVYLPAMLRSPELEVDVPAYIVIFDGDATLEIVGAPVGIDAEGNVIPQEKKPEKASGVVCVVVDGRPTVYANVDTDGWKAP